MFNSLKTIITIEVENSTMKSHISVSVIRTKGGALESAECVYSNGWRMIICSFCIDEFDGNERHIFLRGFYVSVMYLTNKEG